MHAPAPTDVTPQAATGLSGSARTFAFLLEDPRVVGVMATLFAITGLVLALGQLSVDDEGLQTYVFTRWLLLEPVPVFFFQHVKPVVCLLLAIPSLFGVQALRVAQILLAASVAPMLAAVARTLGIRLPNLTALIVLVSPLFVFGAANGVTNVDGVFGTTLVLYLTVARRRHWLAGIVLGCLPWVRPELAVFWVIVWLYMACVERNRGFMLGALIFPVVYTVSGAVYHHDPLWLVHFGPAMKFPIPGNPIWQSQHVDLRYSLARQLLVTPAVAFALTARPSRLSGLERALYAFAWTSFLLHTFVPFLRLGNFGYSPRFFMQPLPVLALLSARALEPWLFERRPARALYLLPVALAAIWIVSRRPPAAVTVPILCAYVAAAVFGFLGWGRSIVAVVAFTACLGLPLPRDEQATPPYIKPALTWLREHAHEIRATTIYTNSAVMAFTITHTADLAETEVRFIVPPDILWEFTELSNPDNQQLDAIRRAARAELYGKNIFWNEIAPDSLPPRSVFLLRADPRLSSMMSMAVWGSRLDEVAAGDSFTIARLVPAGTVPIRPVPLRELSDHEPERVLIP